MDDKGNGVSEKVLKSTGEKVLCKMKFNVYKVVIDDKNVDEIKISLNDDLVKYKWFSIPELKGIKITPPSKELFIRLGFI